MRATLKRMDVGMVSMTTMTRERFTSLWNRCLERGLQAAPGPIYDDLMRRYTESHRRYHTPGHINRCLEEMDLARHLMDDPDAVEMALWFHDAVYDPRANDNELKSAEWFMRLGREWFEPAFCRKVFDLIMATVHKTPPEEKDAQFVVDVDLSSFGLPWDDFKRDSQAVRDEFDHLPDNEFYPGQLRFLNSLLRRETFYCTEFFRRRFEHTARKNIRRYMSELYDRGFSDEDLEQTLFRPHF